MKLGEDGAKTASGPTPYLHLDFFLSVRRATLPFYATDILPELPGLFMNGDRLLLFESESVYS